MNLRRCVFLVFALMLPFSHDESLSPYLHFINDNNEFFNGMKLQQQRNCFDQCLHCEKKSAIEENIDI